MNATYVGLFGLLTFGMGALITGLFWAAAYSRLEARCLEALRERDFYITRAVASQKAHAEAVEVEDEISRKTGEPRYLTRFGAPLIDVVPVGVDELPFDQGDGDCMSGVCAT